MIYWLVVLQQGRLCYACSVLHIVHNGFHLYTPPLLKHRFKFILHLNFYIFSDYLIVAIRNREIANKNSKFDDLAPSRTGREAWASQDCIHRTVGTGAIDICRTNNFQNTNFSEMLRLNSDWCLDDRSSRAVLESQYIIKQLH